MCFTSFMNQFNPRKWKKSLKVQDFKVVNSAICAIFTLCHCKNLAAARWSDFPSEKFYFEIFSKTNAVSITFGLRYIHGPSLTEIDFPTRNADSLFIKRRSVLKSTDFDLCQSINLFIATKQPFKQDIIFAFLGFHKWSHTFLPHCRVFVHAFLLPPTCGCCCCYSKSLELGISLCEAQWWWSRKLTCGKS